MRKGLGIFCMLAVLASSVLAVQRVMVFEEFTATN